MGVIINNQIPGLDGKIVNNLQPDQIAKLLVQVGRGAVLVNNKVVPFDEVPGYRSRWDQDSGEIVRLLMTDWSFEDLFPTAMLGDVGFGNGAPRGCFNRTLPHQHPKKKFLYAMECRETDARGAYQMTDGLIAFRDFVNNLDGKAIFEVIYRRPPWAVLNDVDLGKQVQNDGDTPTYEFGRWIVPDGAFTDEAYTLPGNALRWAQGGQLIPEPLTKQRQIEERRYLWHWVHDEAVKDLFDTTLPQVVGRVNATAFDGCAPGTLLCRPPVKSKLRSTPGGNPVRDVEFIMLRRMDSTWNQFFRRTSNKFEDVLLNAQAGPLPQGQDAPYFSADFGQLFKVGN
ncbi:MAG: hypothetical protein K2R98_08485 [Gemmataceae bacterium]|nr:hypothetical protein [Gemmataceae bacterium]